VTSSSRWGLEDMPKGDPGTCCPPYFTPTWHVEHLQLCTTRRGDCEPWSLLKVLN
jgi:hypothetical protein